MFSSFAHVQLCIVEEKCLPLAENEGEARAETGHCLDGGKHNFPNVGWIIESEDSLDLIESDVAHDLKHILVESTTDLFEILCKQMS